MLLRQARAYLIAVACLVALAVSGAAQAAPPVLTLSGDHVGSTGNFDVLVDKTRSLTIDTLGSVPEERWQRATKPNPNFGFTSAAVWGRLRIGNPAGTDTTRRMTFHYALLDRVELYVEAPDGRFTRTVNGDSLRYSERPFNSHLVMFDVTVPAQHQPLVYFRITSQGSMQISFDVMTPERARDSESDWLFFHGAYYALMLALGLYNLFLFFSIRNRAYFWYVVYAFVFTGTQMALDGTSGRYFFPEHPALTNMFVPLMVAALLNPPLRFAQVFLDTRRHVPRIHRAVNVLLVVNIVPLLLALFAPYAISIRVATLIAMLVCIGCLALGVIVMRKGYRPARFYVLAWSTVLVGTLMYIVMAFGLLPANAFFSNIQKFGGALEVLLLSFALGDQIAILNAERDAAKTAALTMERDLAVTATVQRLFLPKQDTFESESIALRGYYAPAAQSGGDWWWYESGQGDRVRVLLGDVTGHGVGPAMVTAGVAAAYRTIPDEMRRGDIRAVIAVVNQSLAGLCNGAHHMTFGALEIDPHAGKVRLWSAGAPAALILHSDGTIDALAARGTPLGSRSFTVGEATAAVGPGDRIFVFSDGLHELSLASGRQLGYRGVTRMLQRTAGRNADEARAQVAGELGAVIATSDQLDDIAFVIVDLLDRTDARKAA